MTKPIIGKLVFDLDGTLVDSVPDLAGSLDGLMAEKGLPAIGVPAARLLIGHGIPELVRGALALRGIHAGTDGAKADIARFTEIYAGRLSEATRPYPGVEPVLASLADAGWQLAVCTNKLERFARKVLSDLAMDRYFSVISGPDTYGVGKPDPQHLLRTAAAMGPAGGPVVFVGDSEVDIQTARAAGVPVIAVSYGYSKGPIALLMPDAVIDSMDALPAVLDRIFQAPRREAASL